VSLVALSNQWQLIVASQSFVTVYNLPQHQHGLIVTNDMVTSLQSLVHELVWICQLGQLEALRCNRVVLCIRIVQFTISDFRLEWAHTGA
jgi:hypothetical protein